MLMENIPAGEPTIEELIAKALASGVINEEFAEDLHYSEDLEEALGMFYTRMTEQGRDPKFLLKQWGITIDSTE